MAATPSSLGLPAMTGSPAMVVPEEQSFDLGHFCVPDHYRDDLSHIMLTHGMIIDRRALPSDRPSTAHTVQAACA